MDNFETPNGKAAQFVHRHQRQPREVEGAHKKLHSEFAKKTIQNHTAEKKITQRYQT
jgi:hypothetical protein